MSEELKPCPFCGMKANIVEDMNTWCCCSNEGASHGDYLEIKEWNTRPIEDELRAENDALKDILKEWLDDVEHGLFVVAGNGNVSQGIDEGEYYGFRALMANIEKTKKLLGAWKGGENERKN